MMMQTRRKYLCMILYFISLIQTYASASTMGDDEIYYASTALRNVCLEYYPQHKTKIEMGYDHWEAENKEELNKVNSSDVYSKALSLTEMIVRHAIIEKEISMREFEYKCLNIYDVFSEEKTNKQK